MQLLTPHLPKRWKNENSAISELEKQIPIYFFIRLLDVLQARIATVEEKSSIERSTDDNAPQIIESLRNEEFAPAQVQLLTPLKKMEEQKERELSELPKQAPSNIEAEPAVDANDKLQQKPQSGANVSENSQNRSAASTGPIAGACSEHVPTRSVVAAALPSSTSSHHLDVNVDGQNSSTVSDKRNLSNSTNASDERAFVTKSTDFDSTSSTPSAPQLSAPSSLDSLSSQASASSVGSDDKTNAGAGAFSSFYLRENRTKKIKNRNSAVLEFLLFLRFTHISWKGAVFFEYASRLIITFVVI